MWHQVCGQVDKFCGDLTTFFIGKDYVSSTLKDQLNLPDLRLLYVSMFYGEKCSNGDISIMTNTG